MAYKDLHEDPFDETTIAKLQIFEDYAEAWIPTFVMQGVPTIYIFDFFAGTGYDKRGVPGSPIRILLKIKQQVGSIFQKNVRIKLHLNEFEPNRKDQKKFSLLQTACNQFLQDNKDVHRAIGDIEYFNEDFQILFPKLISDIRKYPSLVYLDQNGIKFLSDKYLLELEKAKQADFLYFVSASYFWRFGDSKEFKEHLNIDMATAKKDPYKFVHRNVIEQLRKKLPATTRVKLYPFSLKKGANIHGIIFGASHPRAVDKFLNTAWKRSPINGDANFDIDEDSSKSQLDFFREKSLTKIEAFQQKLIYKVLTGEVRNNRDALLFAYDNGHIGSHADQALRSMKKKGEINYNGTSPLVTYENVFKNSRLVEYEILKT